MKEDGEITSVDNGAIWLDGADRFDEVLEIGDHFRGPTGEVHDINWVRLEPIEDVVYGISGHDFPASGAGIDVAMGAGEVTEFPYIELKDGGIRPAECKVLRLNELGKRNLSHGGGVISGCATWMQQPDPRLLLIWRGNVGECLHDLHQ